MVPPPRSFSLRSSCLISRFPFTLVVFRFLSLGTLSSPTSNLFLFSFVLSLCRLSVGFWTLSSVRTPFPTTSYSVPTHRSLFFTRTICWSSQTVFGGETRVLWKMREESCVFCSPTKDPVPLRLRPQWEIRTQSRGPPTFSSEHPSLYLSFKRRRSRFKKNSVPVTIYVKVGAFVRIIYGLYPVLFYSDY